MKAIHQIIISNDNKSIIPNNYENIEEFFIGYRHTVWNYNSIKKFIIKNNDLDVLNAIDRIKPNAFKADIARYYLIYKIGGWYSDVNNFFSESINCLDYSLVFFKDSSFHTGSSWSVSNGLFYSKSGNSILKDAVDMCISNVNNKYYGGHALCPTGPNLFGSAIAKHNLPENSNYLIGEFLKTKTPGFFINDKLVCKYKPNNLSNSDPGIIGSNSYAEMWQNRSVYSDN